MNDASFRWHYLIYRITNLDNGRYYIGQHRTTNPNDSYMGSGSSINADYEKYMQDGKPIDEHFKKEILFDFSTFEEMNDKEKELVSESVVNDPMSYNMRTGGSYRVQYPKGCILLEYNGKTCSIREWAELLNLSTVMIYQRYCRGMTMDQIISVPPRARDKIWFASNGEGHTIYEWCEKYGLDYNRTCARLRAGWTVDEAVIEPAWKGKTYLYRGRPYKLNQLSELSGISKQNLLARIINYRWPVEKAVETPLTYNPVSIWEQKFEWKGGSYTIEELAKLSDGLVFKQTIHDRIKDGWDMDRIMSTPSNFVDRSWSKKLHDYHGKKITIDEGAKLANLTVAGLKDRIFNHHMTFEDAVDMPKTRKRGKLFEVDGVSKTIHDWAVSTGLNQNLLFQRITKQSLTMKQAIEMGKPVKHKTIQRTSK